MNIEDKYKCDNLVDPNGIEFYKHGTFPCYECARVRELEVNVRYQIRYLESLGYTVEKLSEEDWEYIWGEPGESFEGFDTYETYEEARADFEEESDFESHRVMRRRKAGDWEAMS